VDAGTRSTTASEERHPRSAENDENLRKREGTPLSQTESYALFTGYQIFLLVNEETIRKYKNDLADEVEPTISELIERAESGLATLEKKETLLKTKVTAHLLRLDVIPNVEYCY
jgi:hypothetical protein